MHKFARYTKQQRIFVLFLFGLIWLLVLFPIIKVKPVSDEGYSVWLLNGNFFRTLLVIVASLAALIGRNVSYRFKNMVIGYFGFKENDSLVNFGLLWIIATSFMGVGDAIKVVNDVTWTIKLSGIYYFTQIYILAGLVLTLVSVIKSAKEHSNKTKVINMVDDDALREVTNKKSLKWLFEEEEENE